MYQANKENRTEAGFDGFKTPSAYVKPFHKDRHDDSADLPDTSIKDASTMAGDSRGSGECDEYGTNCNLPPSAFKKDKG
jgi:hypothetical protein